MGLSMQQTVSPKQRRTTNIQSNKQITLPKKMLITSAFIGLLSLSACQTVPTTETSGQTSSTAANPSVTTTTVTQAPVVDNNDYEDDYPIEPYLPPGQHTTQQPLTEQAPIQVPPTAVVITPSSDDYIITPTPAIQPTLPPVIQPAPPSHNELLERARQNSQQQSRQVTPDNTNLPAFQNLMQAGTNQLKSGNLTAAENSFTRAQRLAPKSSAVYFYLAQVALKKKQPRKAEAMARRGLSVSQDASRRRSLWQLILQSGQSQNNPRVIREAQKALR